MSLQINIPESGFRGIEALVQLNQQRVLKQFTDKLLQVKLTFTLSEIVSNLAEQIPELEAEKARLIVGKVLIPLNQLLVDFEMEPDAFLEDFTSALEVQGEKEWLEQYMDDWKEIVPIIQPLLTPENPLVLIGKGIELFANRPNLLLEHVVLSELRPVFNSAGEEMKALLLMNSLVLTYENQEGVHKLHLGIDLDDVENLLEGLKKAKRKNKAVKEQADKLGLTLLFTGTLKELT